MKNVILLWKKIAGKFKPYTKWLALYLFLCAGMAVVTVLSARFRSEFVDLFLDEFHTKQRIYLLLTLNLLVMFLGRYGLPTLQELVAEAVSARIKQDVEAQIGEKKCLIPWLAHEDQKMNDKMELVEGSGEQVWFFFQEMAAILSALED